MFLGFQINSLPDLNIQFIIKSLYFNILLNILFINILKKLAVTDPSTWLQDKIPYMQLSSINLSH